MKFHRRPLALAAALSMALSAPLVAGNANAARTSSTTKVPSSSIGYLQGTVIVKLKGSVPNMRDMMSFGIPMLDAAMKEIGAETRRPLLPMAPYSPDLPLGFEDNPSDRGFERIYVIRYASPYDALAAAELVRKSGAVEFAEPYYTFPLSYNPDDPRLVDQYWLDMVQAEQAWDITKGDSSITIGICDTGVDWLHEDLAANIFTNPGESGKDAQGRDRRTNGIDDDNNGYPDDYHGWDFVGNATLAELQARQYHPDNNPAPTPVSTAGYEGYHGTAVAGCASARPDNATGIAGTGFLTKILPIKCTGDSVGTNAVIAGYDGIRYAADMGARIINCSWGGPGNPGDFQALQAVIDYAYSKGALIIVASGNSGTNNDQTPNVPANFNHVLSVGATDELDSAAVFSQYGVSVGVWAPGVNTLTTMPENAYLANNVSGTSFSSPIVSGIAALVFAKHPDWTPDQVAMQLRITGDRVKVPYPQYAPFFFRRANAFRAVSLNQNLSGNDATNLPGVGVLSYTLNGRAVDTIKSVDQVVDLELVLKNYLAPTKNLKIEAFAGQALMIASAVTVPTIGTMGTATQTLKVKIDPASPVLYSEGNLQLILHLTDGSYEDFLAVPVPISLPGWHQQVDPTAQSIAPYVGGSIAAVTPKVAWTVSNIQNGSNTQTTVFSRITTGNYWTTFQQLSTGTEPVYCIAARDDKRAWAGSGPTSRSAGIFRTADGGSTWNRTTVATITPFVDAIHFFDDSNGIFIGDPLSGKWGIGRTSDRGVTWKALASPVIPASGTEAGWNNSFAAYGDNLWFGTNAGRIYYSNDRGVSWSYATTPSLNSFGIAFTDKNEMLEGLATFSPATGVGGTNAIAYSSDGGASWEQRPLPFTGAQPQGVTIVPGTTRAFVGTQNGVYETSDFGLTWKPMAMPIMTFSGITLSAAADTSTVVAYGTNVYSQLMVYREAVSKPVSSVPYAASADASLATLYQNAPNPFSGSTTIAFDLRRAAHVELSLWDALGHRLLTLADAPMGSGTHSLRLDAAGIPSGSYFYALQVDGEVHTGSLMIAR
jgi:subtilisin family serine protease/photosystem II stability/assembly factor-like uncharacterized protein